MGACVAGAATPKGVGALKTDLGIRNTAAFICTGEGAGAVGSGKVK